MVRGLARRKGGERSGQAAWLAGSVVALVLIHNPCRPPSRRGTTEVEKEREGGREKERGSNREREDRSQPLNIGVEHLDVAMSEITVEHAGIGGLV